MRAYCWAKRLFNYIKSISSFLVRSFVRSLARSTFRLLTVAKDERATGQKTNSAEQKRETELNGKINENLVKCKVRPIKRWTLELMQSSQATKTPTAEPFPWSILQVNISIRQFFFLSPSPLYPNWNEWSEENAIKNNTEGTYNYTRSN